MTEDWADELIFAGIDAETLRRIERKGHNDGLEIGANIALSYPNQSGEVIAREIRYRIKPL